MWRLSRFVKRREKFVERGVYFLGIWSRYFFEFVFFLYGGRGRFLLGYWSVECSELVFVFSILWGFFL